ncbi:hypothetical protein GPN2_12839 [Streptomyces murinus]
MMMPSGAVMEEDTLYLPMDGKESMIVIRVTITQRPSRLAAHGPRPRRRC